MHIEPGAGWISVKDRLPEIPPGKSGIMVIVCVLHFGELQVGTGSFNSGGFMDWVTSKNGWELSPILSVTHWMYYPELPEAEV